MSATKAFPATRPWLRPGPGKFVDKYPSRLKPGEHYVQPRDRIPRWNLVRGDRVRLRVGSAGDKFVDPATGAAGGWKIYTINSTDREKNTVKLEGLGTTRRSPARPDNFDEMTNEEKSKWEMSNGTQMKLRPVQYANLQLCVEENGADSIFATRITTSAPSYSRAHGGESWTRYAAKLSGATTLPVDEARGLVKIGWPIHERNDKPVPASSLDMAALPPSTLHIPSIPSILAAYESAASIIPRTPTIAIPNTRPAQAIADRYFAPPPASRVAAASIDALMPLHLSEELSPRFSRAKRQRGFAIRRDARAADVDAHAARAVAQWEAGGRDAGLLQDEAVRSALGMGSDVLDMELPQRNRTRAEVREAAREDAKAMDRRVASEVKGALARGEVWDPALGEWAAGTKKLMTERKQRRKALKVEKAARRMDRLVIA